MALIATVPSYFIAGAYLRRNKIEHDDDNIVPRFLETAPTAWKVALITLNFVVFGVMFGSGWWLLHQAG